MKLKNKVSLITGSSRGIGYGIAEKLASEGSHLIINGFNPEGVDRAVNRLREKFKQIKLLGIPGDVSREEEVKRIYQESIKTFGTIHNLVNNAGVTKDNLLLRMKVEEWDTVLQVNLKSAFLLSKICARSMIKEGGKIVMISSVVGEMGNVGQANYAASKGGLIALGKSIAREFAGKNINVNMVTPGFIDTEMTDGLSDEVKQSLMTTIPKKKFGKIADVANLVSFLLSDESDYITGQVIGVNGGMIM